MEHKRRKNMKTTIKIKGMHCEGCVKRIENVVSTIKGINEFKVNLEEQNVTLDVKKESILNEVKEKIEDLGFEIV